MREIKFRAWDVYFKQMFDVIRVDWLPGGINVYFYLDTGEEWCSDGCELIQHTGLKDKNGKEIYEGDIVKFLAGESYTITGGVFAYDNFEVINFGQYGWEPFVFEGYDGVIMFYEHNCTIIGNIYKNPELIPTGVPSPN